MLSRPRAPGKRPAAVREGRELSVLEGRAKEKANAKHSWPSRVFGWKWLEEECFVRGSKDVRLRGT